MSRLIEPTGAVLFEENFSGDLANWHHEGTGTIEIVRPGVMRMDCTGGEQGGIGCHAFCRLDFPDHISIEYTLRVLENNGLIITFIAMRGLNGEDILTELPPRKGLFAEYRGHDARMRSYHVSVSRYNDAGEHTGVSNWNRNPGKHLMSQGPDLCKEVGPAYRVTIIKNGLTCQLGVDGVFAHGFTDLGELPDEIPSTGKFGIRAIGSRVVAEISDVRVQALR